MHRPKYKCGDVIEINGVKYRMEQCKQAFECDTCDIMKDSFLNCYSKIVKCNTGSTWRKI